MLGLARRAGRLTMGHDMVLDSIRKRKSKLIVFTADISERLKNEMQRASEQYIPGLSCVEIKEGMDDVHRLLGYRAGVISVNDINFANRITELINQEENEYGDKN